MVTPVIIEEVGLGVNQEGHLEAVSFGAWDILGDWNEECHGTSTSQKLCGSLGLVNL